MNIELRYMETGDRRRDLMAVGVDQTVPRIDPACLPEVVFLALPIDGDRTRVRVREFPRELAADRLTREAAHQLAQGIRLATDEEIAAYHRETAERAEKQRTERARLQRLELEYAARQAGLSKATLDGFRNAK